MKLSPKERLDKDLALIERGVRRNHRNRRFEEKIIAFLPNW